jgi:chaperonin cofactor prefoldin
MEADVQRTKAAYNEALQNLEKISDEIHKLREDQKLNAFPEEVGRFFIYIDRSYLECSQIGLSAAAAIEQKQNISVLSK